MNKFPKEGTTVFPSGELAFLVCDLGFVQLDVFHEGSGIDRRGTYDVFAESAVGE